MQSLMVLLAICCSGLAAGTATDFMDSDLVQYFSVKNYTLYSTLWIAAQAGNLDQYLNESSLAITIFAPTNTAWQKRLPTLTTRNGITVQELFSTAKSDTMASILNYHILEDAIKFSDFKSGEQFSTLSNLCSNAKTLELKQKNGTTFLVSAGGTMPNVLGTGKKIGQSYVYPIDDVLLPSVVTIPLAAALQDTTTGTLAFNPDVAENLSYLDNLQSETANEAQAPTFLQPGVPAVAPAAGKGAGALVTVTTAKSALNAGAHVPAPAPTVSAPVASPADVSTSSITDLTG